MNLEIERKFLLKPFYSVLPRLNTRYIKQIYVQGSGLETLRIRHSLFQDKTTQGVVQVKLRVGEFTSNEYTMEIDADAALAAIQTYNNPVEKLRYETPYGKDGLKWEIDAFQKVNKGLYIVEIELPSEDYKLEIPEWVGKEVTGDPRYYNENLFKSPFCTWI